MKRVSLCDSFDALPTPVECLLREAGSTRPFGGIAWFRNFAANALPAGARLRIYSTASDDNGEPASLVLPLVDDGSGCRLRSLSSFYTPLFEPPVSVAGPELDADLRLLASALATERPAWSRLDLQPMDPSAPLFDALLNAFRRNGMWASRYFCFGNWYLRIAGRRYDDYLTQLPCRLRNTLRRKKQRLQKSGRLQIEIVCTGAGLDAGIAAFEQVYRRSWKQPEPYPNFVPGFIRCCAEQGWLRLGIALIDGTPAAAQLWIVCDGVASIYKLAYDERFAPESAGTVLTAHLMRHVLDVDRVREVDFLAGDDPYKADWMSHRRERWGIVVFNLRTAHGTLLALRHAGGLLRKRAQRKFSRQPEMEQA